MCSFTILTQNFSFLPGKNEFAHEKGGTTLENIQHLNILLSNGAYYKHETIASLTLIRLLFCRRTYHICKQQPRRELSAKVSKLSKSFQNFANLCKNLQRKVCQYLQNFANLVLTLEWRNCIYIYIYIYIFTYM